MPPAACARRAALPSRQPDAVRESGGGPLTALATCLAFTWLNPHVYLDTVVLLGSISSQYEGQKTAFALGAISASFLFFFTLGYGARLLRPLFAQPKAWRVLDLLVAVAMFCIGLGLLI